MTCIKPKSLKKVSSSKVKLVDQEVKHDKIRAQEGPKVVNDRVVTSY